MNKKMNKNKIQIGFALVMMVVLQVGLAFGQSAENAAAQSEASANKALVGAWYYTVLLGTEPPSSFKGMITFSKGGGLVASAQGDILLNPPPGVPPGATSGHGSWVRTANGEYLYTFRQILYNGDGSYAGVGKIRNVATLSDSGNELSGHLILDYYDSSDQLVFTMASTFTATRIVVEPMTP